MQWDRARYQSHEDEVIAHLVEAGNLTVMLGDATIDSMHRCKQFVDAVFAVMP